MNREEEIRRVRGNKNNDLAQDNINYLTVLMWKDMEAKLKKSYEQLEKRQNFINRNTSQFKRSIKPK